MDGEIEALRTRIRNQDESRNDLVVQTEEMKQVLAGLMDQLEAVNKEETIVVGRKKGRDTDRDQKNSQMEKLQKEKKEVEKANEKAQQEIERIKRNRDEEIKKLKKKMEEAQKNAGKKGGDARLVEKLKEDIRELDALLLVVREDLEKRKESGKKDEETINQLRTQLADVTQSRDNLRSMTDGSIFLLFLFFSFFFVGGGGSSPTETTLFFPFSLTSLPPLLLTLTPSHPFSPLLFMPKMFDSIQMWMKKRRNGKTTRR